MKKVINWDIIDRRNIYEQLLEALDKHQKNDRLNIENNCDTNEKDNYLKYLEEVYKLYNQKLIKIKKINNQRDLEKKKHLEIIWKMDNIMGLSKKQRLLMILSYGVLVDYFKKLLTRSEEAIFMLSACSSDLDLEDYTFYIGVLSDKRIAELLVEKTDNLGEQVNLAYDIMDSQDNFPYDFITSENYEELVNNGINILNKYDVSKEKKNIK